MNPLIQALMQLLQMSPGAASPAGGAGGASPSQGIGTILQQVMGILSSLGAGSYGQTELGNLNNLWSTQQNAANLAMNPLAMARRAAMAAQPLNKELAYSVTNAADAANAGRGLAQSPGATASAQAAALAPYAQQNLEMGQQDAQFGFPYQFARQPMDYLGVLNQLNQYGQNSTYSLPGGVMP